MMIPRKRVAISQSNYIPWKGYFDMISRVDEFVLLDDVQFTKRDWRNRNLIKTVSGTVWLTIPVITKSRYEQRICDTEIDDPDWCRRHWRAISTAYHKAPFWRWIEDRVEALYLKCADERNLSRINHAFLVELCALLNIETKISWSMDYGGTERKTERLLGICRAAGAKTYLSGPAARAYLNEASFADADMVVEWMDYGRYGTYPQMHGPFEHGVSIVDLLANLGPDAAGYLRAT